MNVTYETLNLMLLLFPGLISSRIIHSVRRYKDNDPVRTIFTVIIFSSITYMVVSLFHDWQPIAELNKDKDGHFTYSIVTDWKVIITTFVCSVILPVIVLGLAHHDYHMAILRWLKVTNSTSRETAWDDAFTREARHLVVHLKSGLRIAGWPEYFSNTKDEGYIYIQHPAWIDGDQYIETKSHGILVDKKEIQLVEFLLSNTEKENIYGREQPE